MAPAGKCRELQWLPVTARVDRGHLDLVNLRPEAGASFVVKHGAGAQRCPQPFPLPAGVGIVDAAVDILTEKTHRVRNAYDHELAVDQRGHRFAAIRHRKRHVSAESQFLGSTPNPSSKCVYVQMRVTESLQSV